MPTETSKLKIMKPLGNETVSRVAFNENWDQIDKMAVREPFLLEAPIYDAANDRIVCTIGPGVAELFNGDARITVINDVSATYYINAPAINTIYYLYLQADGTFTHNTTGTVPAGAVLLWQVATGATVSTLTKTDRRAQISGTGAKLAAHLAETAQTNDVHGLKTLFQNQKFTNLLKNGDFASWSQGDTVAPDGWTWAYAASSTIAKESVEKKIGNYSCKIVRSGGSAYIYQLIPNYLDYAGKKVTMVAWAKVISGSGRIVIDDGVVLSETVYSGSGGWQLLTLTFTVAVSPTQLKVYCSMETDGTGYFDGVMLVEGELPVAFANHPNDQHLKAVDFQDSADTNYTYGIMREQSGIAQINDTASTKTITFPSAFRKLLDIEITPITTAEVIRADSGSTTGFTATRAGTSGNNQFYWRAKGVL